MKKVRLLGEGRRDIPLGREGEGLATVPVAMGKGGSANGMRPPPITGRPVQCVANKGMRPYRVINPGNPKAVEAV
jgi:hypothetical protein